MQSYRRALPVDNETIAVHDNVSSASTADTIFEIVEALTNNCFRT